MNQYINLTLKRKLFVNIFGIDEKTTTTTKTHKPYIYCLPETCSFRKTFATKIPVLSSVSVESFAFYYGQEFVVTLNGLMVGYLALAKIRTKSMCWSRTNKKNTELNWEIYSCMNNNSKNNACVIIFRN